MKISATTEKPKYKIVRDHLKKMIQQGELKVGDYLPSEHAVCAQFGITRTTIRKALDELLNDGFIVKEKGKGSRVVERMKALGLLTVKGFSEAAGDDVKTIVLQSPELTPWSDLIGFKLKANELKSDSVFFKRLRYINDVPVMLEQNWYSSLALPLLKAKDFVDGSFFKTLSRNHLIEIRGAEQMLYAETAGEEIAKQLQISVGSPVLHISIRFKTTKPELNIYSEVYCNTHNYPIGNRYIL